MNLPSLHLLPPTCLSSDPARLAAAQPIINCRPSVLVDIKPGLDNAMEGSSSSQSECFYKAWPPVVQWRGEDGSQDDTSQGSPVQSRVERKLSDICCLYVGVSDAE